MRWRIRFAIVWFVLQGAVAAQADDATRMTLARELVVVSKGVDAMRAGMTFAIDQMRDKLRREGGGNVDSAGAYLGRLQQSLDAEIPELSQAMAMVYARHFTEQDLEGLLVFYRSPVGQHFINEQNDLNRQMAELGQSFASKVTVGLLSEPRPTATPPTLPDPQRWRDELIAQPARKAVIDSFVVPMERPLWTALRTLTLANLLGESCRGAHLDTWTLRGFIDQAGLESVSADDLELASAIVMPQFSYFDRDKMVTFCAASDYLFGIKGVLVPNLVTSGIGVPSNVGWGYVTVRPFLAFHNP